MAETALSATQIEESGGFRIQISVNEMSASACTSKGKNWALYLIFVAIFGFAFVSEPTTQSGITIVVLGVALVIRFLFTGTHDLRCTREVIEVIDTYSVQAKRVRSFPRDQVKRIWFGTVSYSKYGGNGGIVFESMGKKIKALYGLQCVEAQKILAELERLGYDVYHDPGMPMAVEMAQSRRKSWLGRMLP